MKEVGGGVPIKSVLVTGGTGFVGAALLEVLAKVPGISVVAPVRQPRGAGILGVSYPLVAGIDAHTPWAALLGGVDTVIHAAARVHILNEPGQGALERFRQVNLAGTVHLAESAAAAGVKRFVFLSTIKVNGESTGLGHRFRADDPMAPTDAYATSKAEAEVQLQRIASETGMEVVIIRPVLVYGPGVKANFLSMMRWLDRGIPLPLASTTNARSLVCIQNLVDFIVVCTSHPDAGNQVFLVSDAVDLSTTQLLTRTAHALGVRPRLFAVSPWLMLRLARFLGKGAQADRLLGSLQVDISKNKTLLGWEPPIGVDEALIRTARYFKECQR